MLTDRQQKTISHLEEFCHITRPEDIIRWCEHKISLPRRRQLKNKVENPEQRKESKQYYRDIIEALK